MKAEFALSRLSEILARMGGDAPQYDELKAFADELETLTRSEAAASSGRGNALKTVERLLKDCRKHGNDSLHYAWMDAEGRQCVCDGFRAFRLYSPLPLEPRPEDWVEPVPLEKIYPAKLDDYEALPLPTAAVLRAHIKVEQAKHGRNHGSLWDFGEGRPAVNAAYLLDMLTVLPDALSILCKRGAAGYTAPLYAFSELGDAIIMPALIDAKKAERAAMQAKQAERAATPANLTERAVMNAKKDDDRRRAAWAKRREILKDYREACEDEEKQGRVHNMNPETFAELAACSAELAA